MMLRKKPTTVEAVRWTGDNQDEIRAFAGDAVRQQVRMGWIFNNLEVDTAPRAWDLELLAGFGGVQGWVPVPIGHWIFGVPGDFWPVADEYVSEHYEVVGSQPDSATTLMVAFQNASAHACRLEELAQAIVNANADDEVIEIDEACAAFTAYMKAKSGEIS